MIFNLQILRGFAALNVALAHTIFVAGQYNQNTNFLSYLDGWGINGVDIFFVISGFVMLHTQLYLSPPLSFGVTSFKLLLIRDHKHQKNLFSYVLQSFFIDES